MAIFVLACSRQLVHYFLTRYAGQSCYCRNQHVPVNLLELFATDRQFGTVKKAL